MANGFKAEVIAVYPNKVKFKVDDLENFQVAEQSLRIGSFVEVADNENAKLLAAIENFAIVINEKNGRDYIIEAKPLGTIKGEVFIRGGDELAIPPKSVQPARIEDIRKVYEASIKTEKKFTIAKLARVDINVPLDGDKFFNKHIAIVGATGSGKSHTVTKIIQNATTAKVGEYTGLNNSHIVIFDIHSEYKSAFDKSNYIDVSNLVLPYWLFNSDELEELFLESGDFNNYNQASLLRNVITANKRVHNPGIEKVFFDSPLPFDIKEVQNCLINLSNETVNSEDSLDIQFSTGTKKFASEKEKLNKYFEDVFVFSSTQRASKEKIGISRGAYADGSIDKFIARLAEKLSQDRLQFLFGEKSKKITFDAALQSILGFKDSNKSNITILDVSAVPFEVMSITISLITRMLFEFGYYLKKECSNSDNHTTPLLLVYEEAHKYAPKSNLARYRSSLNAIERIAKEGRKYGVTLLIASQRPSEISETIFSQCNNFIAMRLTNPDDQNYVKRLLPDSLGDLTDTLPTLKSGEAIMIGDAIVMPSIVVIDRCNPEPSSSDIPYLTIWKKEWMKVEFEKITAKWQNK